MHKALVRLFFVSHEAMYSSSSFHISSSCCFLLSRTSSNGSLKVSSSSLSNLPDTLEPSIYYCSGVCICASLGFQFLKPKRELLVLFASFLCQIFCRVLLLSLTSDLRSSTTLETSCPFSTGIWLFPLNLRDLASIRHKRMIPPGSRLPSSRRPSRFVLCHDSFCFDCELPLHS